MPYMLFVMLVAMSSVQGSGTAVQRPDLAGQWVIDPKFYSPNAAAAPICERECSITQDKALLIVKVRDKVTEYRLDGVPTIRNLKVAEYSPQIKTTARWEGQTLLIIVLVKVEDSEVETRSKLSTKDGRLVIETTSSSKPDRRDEFTRKK